MEKLSLRKIIKEELINYIHENYDENYFDLESSAKDHIFHEFLYKNNDDFTNNIRWQLVPYPRLKKIWEDYMQMGVVRDTKGLDMITDILIDNSIKIIVITELCGHTSSNPEDDYEEYLGYFIDEQLNCVLPHNKIDTSQLEIPFDNPNGGYKEKEPADEPEPCTTKIHPYIQELFEENYEEGMTREKFREILYENLNDKFLEYFVEDPISGHAYITDYAYDAILVLAQQLNNETNAEKKLVTADKLLNVVHQRSDIASWLVEGGSRALSQLSGYRDTDEDSAISGSYNMRDY